MKRTKRITLGKEKNQAACSYGVAMEKLMDMHPYGFNLVSSCKAHDMLGKAQIRGISCWETLESTTGKSQSGIPCILFPVLGRP